MTHIPNDFHARFTGCIARSDRAEAGRLANVITAAKAAGNATGAGWDDDLSKLAAIIEGRPAGLAKRYEAGAAPIPPDLRARADSIVRAIEHAKTPVEKAAATAKGEALLAELAGRKALAKALGEPKTMGLVG